MRKFLKDYQNITIVILLVAFLSACTWVHTDSGWALLSAGVFGCAGIIKATKS